MSVSDDVVAIIAKQLDRKPAEFTMETDLEDEGFTSIDMVEVIFAIEEKFSITANYNANDSAGAQLRTVGDMVAFVEKSIAEHKAP